MLNVVKQGEVLSPILFCVYIGDLLSRLNVLVVGVILGYILSVC